MFCPKCASANITVTAEKHLYNEYRVYRGLPAKIMTFLQRFVQSAIRDVYGPECLCLECGYTWLAKKEMLERRYKEHLSKHLGGREQLVLSDCDGRCVSIDTQGLTVYKNGKQLFEILHEQITDVRYQENLGPLYGWLSVRTAGSKKQKFPLTYAEAKKDKTTVFYNFSDAQSYYALYSALKAIAEENKRAGLFK